ncbi:MAG: hypothetical protein ACI8PB_000045 [Desulforhopalus sp.]|jgi:hypothetical protein
MELKSNQSALILEADEDVEITVEVASPDQNGLSGSICIAIAKKLMQDADFQAELMRMVDISPLITNNR